MYYKWRLFKIEVGNNNIILFNISIKYFVSGIASEIRIAETIVIETSNNRITSGVIMLCSKIVIIIETHRVLEVCGRGEKPVV